ncbi:tetrathionate reductase family octaheme c-type cytochrome [Lutimaribacter sp. EGI FJ00015]|uniref:Tetrathionate reductase family octaheme c-type cytochrome n=1 Tax=Lutimaribacter degradans TaxID=2945989 RepID=A0ACC5ZV27_9RHOB|nr:tetrathionate reductase family octaheme c-type cytochrome [Lutimaribacter sp. EGI FJ00013]MCM2562208.1 tetrathionate reductase family octaheme c-type cytochrome [Lutimaribacter sp. EGI FJ00013]MCO0613363.1 tetrathionate reductase family octaheme c-type cytochrome [Lutimaribacter sp. EGI FJ00015]MCO0636337.1 tetrathionate reductase family octaheme c-type cytochrome [Lutimaribacter sp. EGI FJ00014]
MPLPTQTILGLLALTLWAVGATAQGAPPEIPGRDSTADHSKFEILKQEFDSGPEVTKACISCHTEADDQVMHSIHFNWNFEHPETGQQLGKRNVINAFCGSVAGNEPRCTSCHAGYGWEDMSQPPPQQSTAVDCLVCHDRSGQYAKSATDAGHPPLDPVKPGTTTITGAEAWAVDLSQAAQSVGMPGRENCGSCHFYGGGGDNVKHGDLSSVLYDPPREVDVHMSAEGENFTCATCHVTDRHQWDGSRYATHASDEMGTGKPGARRDVATCQSCHDNDPHEATIKGIKLNDHTDVLACQTCHIPEFARGGVATKTWWDWSTAGKLKDGNPYHEDGFTQSDGQQLHTYLSTKGDFEWAENVAPIYAWFDGQVEYTTGNVTIDPEKVVEVNKVSGARDDGRSRIWPFKRMEGRQAYDKTLNHLAYTHVWGPTTDTAFWTNFDWSKAIEAGMKAAGQEYSGEYGFVDTHMYWPITHMVAPAEQALDCESCHATDGRMVGLAGVFLPGSNPNGWAGLLGRLIVLAALAGVALHILLRVISGKKGGTS